MSKNTLIEYLQEVSDSSCSGNCIEWRNGVDDDLFEIKFLYHSETDLEAETLWGGIQ